MRDMRPRLLDSTLALTPATTNFDVLGSAGQRPFGPEAATIFDVHLRKASVPAILEQDCVSETEVRLPGIPPSCKLSKPAASGLFASRRCQRDGSALNCER